MHKFKYLITGCCGMVGSHMLELLSSEQTIGTYYNPTVDLQEIQSNAKMVECDVRYFKSVLDVISVYKPQNIFHLAAQSYPTKSWEFPQDTIDVNVVGTINLFEAVKYVRRTNHDYDPVVVIACSSAQYGSSLTPENTPVTEDTLLQPLHPYGVSKVGQDLLGYQYYINDKIKTIRARIFNTTGPRKKGDVISDFASRLIDIEKHPEKVLRVGNLKSKRAILDVSDLIEALLLLSQKGVYGEAYNICNNKVYSIEEVLNEFKKLLSFELKYEIDPKLLRNSDEKVIYGDTTKITKDTFWQPKIDLPEIVKRVFEYYRNKTL